LPKPYDRARNPVRAVTSPFGKRKRAAHGDPFASR
jgi:hypothetical protein